jgi:hypothetical protein
MIVRGSMTWVMKRKMGSIADVAMEHPRVAFYVSAMFRGVSEAVGNFTALGGNGTQMR